MKAFMAEQRKKIRSRREIASARTAEKKAALQIKNSWVPPNAIVIYDPINSPQDFL